MPKFKKEYIVIGACVVLSLVMYTRRISCSSGERRVIPVVSGHEPFSVSPDSSSSSDDTTSIQIGGFTLGIPNFGHLFGENMASSPEEEAEEDVLSETALSLAVPKHLGDKMASLKPFIKLILRSKKSSPKEEEEFIRPLRRATSEKTLPIPKVSHTRRPSAEDEIPGSLLVGHEDDDDQEPDSTKLSAEKQREKNKIQQLLLEAAQTALEAKEGELKARTKLLEEKERKLEEKFSKKGTAAITAGVSLVTTLAGTLTAYYTSQCSTK